MLLLSNEYKVNLVGLPFTKKKYLHNGNIPINHCDVQSVYITVKLKLNVHIFLFILNEIIELLKINNNFDRYTIC